jgi:hypothetical protein
MRVIKEFVKEEIRISIFSWNNKYIVKYEMGPMEQTFKISETEILEEVDLEALFAGEFFEKVKLRFEEMGLSLRKQLENF